MLLKLVSFRSHFGRSECLGSEFGEAKHEFRSRRRVVDATSVWALLH